MAGAGAVLEEHQVGVPGRLHLQVLVAEAADQQALEAALEGIAIGPFRLRQPAAGRIDRMDELEEVVHPDLRAAGEDVFRVGEGLGFLAPGHGSGMLSYAGPLVPG